MTLTVEQEQLVLDHTKLSYYFARKYFYDGFTQDDFASVGFIGLIKASKLFDKSLGYKFSTLAAKCINGEIIKSIRKKQIQTISLNESYEGDEITERMDFVASEVSVEDDVQLKMDIPLALAKLTKREREIIIQRFGLDESGEPLSQLATGELLGITQQHVGRIEKAALAKLRFILDSERTMYKK
ncbi:MAG: sigma-70 family RNA polymerase sigma factor [Lysinibacillus sp.]